jgi:hypothetical protein
MLTKETEFATRSTRIEGRRIGGGKSHGTSRLESQTRLAAQVGSFAVLVTKISELRPQFLWCLLISPQSSVCWKKISTPCHWTACRKKTGTDIYSYFHQRNDADVRYQLKLFEV